MAAASPVPPPPPAPAAQIARGHTLEPLSAEDAAGSAPEKRQERGRAAALLAAYYGIGGADGKATDRDVAGSRVNGCNVEQELDRQGFDARRHFDNIVSTTKCRELLRRANEVAMEVRDLDGDMQMIAYENYNKFIRATDVTKQVKTSVEGLEPDLKLIEGSFSRMSERQRQVDEAVSGRARQVEVLLRQQKLCKKLKVLFDLPVTLRRCCERGAYGCAVEAYCSCAAFLRQHKEIPSFKTVLEAVELQMGMVRTALEQRLCSSDLAVDEAVKSSMTLCDLGEDRASIGRGYLSGRAAMLRASLDDSFASAADIFAADVNGLSSASASSSAAAIATGASELPRGNDDTRQRAAGEALRRACELATQRYIPCLSDAVEGFQRLQESSAATSEDDALTTFVGSRIEDLFGRVAGFVADRCPSTQSLVVGVDMLKDALQRLQILMPRLVARLYVSFIDRVACNVVRMRFDEAAAELVADFVRLHGECRRLQESTQFAKGAAPADGVPPQVVAVEQALQARCLDVLGDLLPLLRLLESEHGACQSVAREVQRQLHTILGTVAEACTAYVSQEVPDESLGGTVLKPKAALLEEMRRLEWSGVFGLALVWLAWRLEDKALTKIWTTAQELFVNAPFLSSEIVAPQLAAAVSGAQDAAKAVLAHYVMVSGQRLAHFFRNAIRNRQSGGSFGGISRDEPSEPSLVVDMVLKEVHDFETQVARMLGDPRRQRTGQQRRVLGRNNRKDSMELEMERLWGRKLQVYAPVPFTRPGTLLGILRVAFKALVEYLRDETLTRRGLQQVQLDCALLAEVTKDFVETEDVAVLESLLGEALNSARHRCDEPAETLYLLDPLVVERICEEKKRSLGFD
eukprot:TRINITY_DN34318_c0_g1_i1.p1 TRINITY_DN34318_c0_g1~~TRINITY_DN34318_c0_g1_i1.p1  ORF type:complete len:861 (-),score=201.35 TRINITY_DN34318_c0_g1_i1:185-2767(-)